MRILKLFILIILLNGCKNKNNEENLENKFSKQSKNQVNNDESNDVKKDDSLIVNDEVITILLYPSEKEIDSLKKEWGEDKFYLAADGEDGYSSSIIKLLKEKREKYINTDKKTIYFKSTNLHFYKKSINNSWGVLTYKDKKFTFKNSTDYIEYIEKNISNKSEKKCEINQISDRYNFIISQDNENGISEKVQIDIENKKSKSHQKIKYNFNSFTTSEIPCSSISYFNNMIKIDEGIENFHNFILGDFNFDGLEDFAYLFDSGGNGGPSFTYFFQNKNNEFLEAKEFPLQQSYFPKEINNKDKTLTLRGPIGCCKIEITVYQLNKNNKWIILNSKEESIK
jgi:hypothetical protein